MKPNYLNFASLDTPANKKSRSVATGLRAVVLSESEESEEENLENCKHFHLDTCYNIHHSMYGNNYSVLSQCPYSFCLHDGHQV